MKLRLAIFTLHIPNLLCNKTKCSIIEMALGIGFITIDKIYFHFIFFLEPEKSYWINRLFDKIHQMLCGNLSLLHRKNLLCNSEWHEDVVWENKNGTSYRTKQKLPTIISIWIHQISPLTFLCTWSNFFCIVACVQHVFASPSQQLFTIANKCESASAQRDSDVSNGIICTYKMQYA